MNSYKIERWDVILYNNIKLPMIYIKPDLNLIKNLDKLDNTVLCKISGTNMAYDRNKIVGSINNSSTTPNCRPNFFEKTGYYVITLFSNWHGYPNISELGLVEFENFEKETETKQEPENSQIIKEDYKYESIFGYIFIILVIVVLILAVLVYKFF